VITEEAIRMLQWRARVVLGLIAATSCAFLAFNRTALKRAVIPTVLYTASHSEMAPFQRVWNPDTRSDYSIPDFTKDSDAEEDDGDSVALCGDDGSKCPKVPAFRGEEYFDSKPIGF
jgi:hypothetical protein